MSQFLDVRSGQTATDWIYVTLKRSEVKNAFHPAMIAELTDVFKAVKPDVSGVILQGEGTAFCAGADLNWMKEMVHYTHAENLVDSSKLWDMFDAVLNCPVPVVGLVHGAVYGGALGLVAACDYVIAEENTKFCFSEVKLGLAPAVISSFVLKKVSQGMVRPYMLTGDVFNEVTALRMGLVHQLEEKLNDKVLVQIEKKFKSNGALAMRSTKKLLNDLSADLTWSEQKSKTTELISDLRVSHEAQIRLKSFLTKP